MFFARKHLHDRDRRTQIRVWAALVTLCGLALMHFALARPALAEELPPHLQLRGPGVEVGQAWLGSYRTFAGEPWVWCIDAGKGAPVGHYKWTSRQVEAPQEAYLLWKYGPQANDLNHAALSFIVHKSAELPHDQLWKLPDSAPRSHGGPLAKRVEELRKEATDFAGPYEVRARLVDESGAKLGTAPRILIDDVARAHLEIEVRSASGKLVPGVELSLRKDDGKPGLKGIGKGIISE